MTQRYVNKYEFVCDGYDCLNQVEYETPSEFTETELEERIERGGWEKDRLDTHYCPGCA